jgi:hypothetical protein
MNFREQQDAIIQYIKNEYGKYTGSLPAPDDYTTEFPDLDRYRNNCTVFIGFGGYRFENETNSSELQEIDMSVCLVVRGAAPEQLREKMLDYTTAFYEMFYANRSLGGAVDYGRIDAVNFYEYAEGSQSVKAAEIGLVLHSET